MNIDLSRGPIVVDNFLNLNDIHEINRQLDDHRWQYGNRSYETSQNVFWFQHHYDTDKNLKSRYDFIHTVMSEYIKNKVNLKLRLYRVNANAQTYGQDGDYHIDYSPPHNTKYMTCIIYLTPTVNKENAADYGGCINFDLNDTILSVQPIFNRAVFFNSTIPHQGVSFNRFETKLRVSLAYVFEVL